MPRSIDFMRRCLELALLGKGHTYPNPMVGAVLAHQDRIISEGFHHRHGSDHAEVDCLKNLPPDAVSLLPDCTMYVNLEPCAHHGHTPPCAQKIIDVGLKKVLIANTDPNPLVAGKGLQMLHEAGISTETGLCSAEGAWLNRRFFCFHTHKRPYIILKWAQAGPHFFAPADRSRLQLTGPEAQLLTHQWRTEESAFMVGTQTALSDNPQLTARLISGRQPLRIALDPQLRIPSNYHMLDQSTPTWIVNTLREGRDGMVHYVKMEPGEGFLPALLTALYHEKIISLVVEGGANLLRQFIDTGLWDEARIFTAPTQDSPGIGPPVLHSARKVYTQSVGADVLDVYLSATNPYNFQPGLGL